MASNGGQTSTTLAAENVDVYCVDGEPQVSPKTLKVSIARGTTVINWHANDTVSDITNIEFVDPNQQEFVELRKLSNKHWQCKDKCDTEGTWEYRLWAICEGGGSALEADPYIQNGP